MANLYVFKAKTDSRIYKICIFADTLESAQEKRDKFFPLYQHHSDRYANAVRFKGLQVQEFEDKSNENRSREVSLVKNKDFIWSWEEFAGKEKYKELHARRMGIPYAGMYVFNIEEVLLDSFFLEYAKFDEYIMQEEQKIEKLTGANHPKIIEILQQYEDAISELMTRYDEEKDMVKFKIAQRKLNDCIKEEVDFDLLDQKYYDKYSTLSNVMKPYQSSVSDDPALYGITPLMRLMAREIEVGNSIPDTLKANKAEALQLLKKEANINETDLHGRTALMYIFVGEDVFGCNRMKGREEFTKFLLENGADPMVQDALGNTALDYALEYAGEEHPTVELLKKTINEIAIKEISKSELKSESQAQLLLSSRSNPVFSSMIKLEQPTHEAYSTLNSYWS